MMEFLVNAVSLALVAGATATFVAIVRDVFEYLDDIDQASLRAWNRFSSVTSMNRSIGNAWKAHAQRFPESHKRILFAGLLVGAPVSFICYPLLWLAFHR